MRQRSAGAIGDRACTAMTPAVRVALGQLRERRERVERRLGVARRDANAGAVDGQPVGARRRRRIAAARQRRAPRRARDHRRRHAERAPTIADDREAARIDVAPRTVQRHGARSERRRCTRRQRRAAAAAPERARPAAAPRSIARRTATSRAAAAAVASTSRRLSAAEDVARTLDGNGAPMTLSGADYRGHRRILRGQPRDRHLLCAARRQGRRRVLPLGPQSVRGGSPACRWSRRRSRSTRRSRLPASSPQHGIAGNWLWWNIGDASGILTVFFFATLWRRSGVLTDVEFIELRYGGRAGDVRCAACAPSIQGVLVNTIIMGWVNLAMVKVLSLTLHVPTTRGALRLSRVHRRST